MMNNPCSLPTWWWLVVMLETAFVSSLITMAIYVYNT